MNVNDVLIELLRSNYKLYPIGSYVKMHPTIDRATWYIPDIMKILDYTQHQGMLLYVVNKKFRSGEKITNQIHPAFIIQDGECVSFERKLKMKQLETAL